MSIRDVMPNHKKIIIFQKSWHERLFTPDLLERFQPVVPMSRHVRVGTLPIHTGIFQVVVPMSRHVRVDTLPNQIENLTSVYKEKHACNDVCKKDKL